MGDEKIFGINESIYLFKYTPRVDCVTGRGV